MSLYTIHQFYFSVNQLLEKYNAKKPGFLLRVNFEIQEACSGLEAHFFISYGPKGADSDDRIYALGSSPAIALQKLEEALRERHGGQVIESVGVAIHDLA